MHLAYKILSYLYFGIYLLLLHCVDHLNEKEIVKLLHGGSGTNCTPFSVRFIDIYSAH